MVWSIFRKSSLFFSENFLPKQKYSRINYEANNGLHEDVHINDLLNGLPLNLFLFDFVSFPFIGFAGSAINSWAETFMLPIYIYKGYHYLEI